MVERYDYYYYYDDNDDSDDDDDNEPFLCRYNLPRLFIIHLIHCLLMYCTDKM